MSASYWMLKLTITIAPQLAATASRSDKTFKILKSIKKKSVQVLLHNPTETPKISDFGLAINPGMETRVAIEPMVTKASPLIRKTPVAQRQCIFASEGNLSYFR